MKNTTVRFTLGAVVLLAIGGGFVRAQNEVQMPTKIGNAKINTDVRAASLIPKIDFLEARLAKLEANNAALKDEVETLQKQANQSTKDMAAAKFMIVAMDKALGNTNKNLADLNTNYAKHTHTIPFGFSNPATVVNAPNPILVPWVSPGQIKGSFRTDGPTK